jgi:uncharacterized protein with NAD-binding domain and iron-sulfur cluster
MSPANDTAPTARKRVIIIGAGLGGLAAAWRLSTRSDVDIIVYEASWVPGGKAASGRKHPEPSFGEPHLIEEHGLHMLFGTYHETWRMLADCYRELNRPVHYAFRRIEEAFTPQRRIAFDLPARRNQPREHWGFVPEQHPGNPWDDVERDQPTGDTHRLQVMARRLDLQPQWLLTDAVNITGAAARPRDLSQQRTFRTWSIAERKMDADASDQLKKMRGWAGHAGSLYSPMTDVIFRLSRPELTLQQLLRLATNARRTTEVIDLGFAILDGTRELRQNCQCAANRQQCECLDQLNDQDLREWLKKAGWSDTNDAIVRGFYAGFFALDGELAAGVGLRAILRVLFDYRGSLVYRMESGMGEVVVAPIYRTLRKRNVKFRFLTRLAGLEVSGNRVSTLHFERLATLPKDYEPVKTVDSLHGTIEYLPTTPPGNAGVPAAPSGEFHQMHRRWPTSGEEERIDVGDNDVVILAVPPKVLNNVASALKTNSRWKDFLDGPSRTKSRPIASVQVWREVDAASGRNPITGAVAAGHTRPFEIWADMSHLISHEGSPHFANEVSFICGPSDNGERGDTQQAEIDRAEQLAKDWLSTETNYMLKRPGEERHRYVAASLEPSDEYVLSLPNTIATRIDPADTGFTNLTVAGDWVKSDLDCGCVEAAVTGGIRAAQFIP